MRSDQVMFEVRDGHKLSVRVAVVEWSRKNAPGATIGEVFELADRIENAIASIANEAYRIGVNHKIYDEAK